MGTALGKGHRLPSYSSSEFLSCHLLSGAFASCSSAMQACLTVPSHTCHMNAARYPINADMSRPRLMEGIDRPCCLSGFAPRRRCFPSSVFLFFGPKSNLQRFPEALTHVGCGEPAVANPWKFLRCLPGAHDKRRGCEECSQVCSHWCLDFHTLFVRKPGRTQKMWDRHIRHGTKCRNPLPPPPPPPPTRPTPPQRALAMGRCRGRAGHLSLGAGSRLSAKV